MDKITDPINPYLRKEMGYKICSKCKLELPPERYDKAKVNKDGLAGVCKTCNRETQRRWRNENREKVREAGRRFMRRNPESVLRGKIKAAIKLLINNGYIVKENANANITEKAKAKDTL